MDILSSVYTHVITVGQFLAENGLQNQQYERYSPRFNDIVLADFKPIPTMDGKVKEHNFTLNELLIQAVTILLKKNNGKGGQNIISLGFSQNKGKTCFALVNSMNPSLELYGISPAFQEMSKNIWKILHTIIGDACLLMLLTQLSIFVKKSESFLQIAGQPLQLKLVQAKLRQMAVSKNKESKSKKTESSRKTSYEVKRKQLPSQNRARGKNDENDGDSEKRNLMCDSLIELDESPLPINIQRSGDQLPLVPKLQVSNFSMSQQTRKNSCVAENRCDCATASQFEGCISPVFSKSQESLCNFDSGLLEFPESSAHHSDHIEHAIASWKFPKSPQPVSLKDLSVQSFDQRGSGMSTLKKFQTQPMRVLHKTDQQQFDSGYLSRTCTNPISLEKSPAPMSPVVLSSQRSCLDRQMSNFTDGALHDCSHELPSFHISTVSEERSRCSRKCSKMAHVLTVSTTNSSGNNLHFSSHNRSSCSNGNNKRKLECDLSSADVLQSKCRKTVLNEETVNSCTSQCLTVSSSAEVANGGDVLKKPTRGRRGKKRPKISKCSYSFHKVLPRRRLLHGQSLNECLPRNFLLNSDDVVENLKSLMFDFGSDLQGGSRELPESFFPLLQLLLQNHKKMKYGSILNYYCPYQNSKARRSLQAQPMKSLIQKYCSHQQVFLFVRKCVYSVVPLDLFGSKRNRTVFLKRTREFISLGLHESFTLGRLMTKVKVSDCHWLRKCSHGNCTLAVFLWWLLTTFVSTLLKSYFHLTVSCVYHNLVFYYRKTVWRQMVLIATKDLLKTKMFKEISQVEASEAINSKTSLGLAKLRFTPKQKSLRPIVSYRHIFPGQSVCVNTKLRNLFHALRFKKKAMPGLCGHGIENVDQVYPVWRDFVKKLKERNDRRPLYFVTADFEGCYDNIIPDKMQQIISTLMPEKEVFVFGCFDLISKGGQSASKRCETLTFPLVDLNKNYDPFLKKLVRDRTQCSTVVIPKATWYHETSENLMQKLNSLLHHNIIQIGQRYYLQTKGITQGCVLSSALNDFYIGDLDKNHLMDIGDDEVILRCVDDVLFVTPCKQRAEKFMGKMLKGFPEYNCHVNKNKVMVNFDPETVQCAEGDRTASDAFFPWCGLLFNPVSLDVHIDYTRYIGVSIQECVTCETSSKPGEMMKSRLSRWIMWKCHAVLFDTSVISRSAVVINIHHRFLMGAFRFLCHVRKLSHWNFDFLLGTIDGMVSSFYWQTVRSLHKVEAGDLAFGISTVKWICYHSFMTVLGPHAGQFSKLLKRLRRRKDRLSQEMDEPSKSLMKEVIRNELPAMFKNFTTR